MTPLELAEEIINGRRIKRKEAVFREEKAGAFEDPWRNESLQRGQGSAG